MIPSHFVEPSILRCVNPFHQDPARRSKVVETSAFQCQSFLPPYFTLHPPIVLSSPGINFTAPVPNSFRLVVEQTGVLLHKGDAELLGGLEDGLVVLATAGRGDVLGA